MPGLLLGGVPGQEEGAAGEHIVGEGEGHHRAGAGAARGGGGIGQLQLAGAFRMAQGHEHLGEHPRVEGLLVVGAAPHADMGLEGVEEAAVAAAEVAVRQGAQAPQLVVPHLRGGALQGHERHLQGQAGVGRDLAVPVRRLLQGEVDDGGPALAGLAEAGALLLQQRDGAVHGAHGHPAQLPDQPRLGDAPLARVADGLQHRLEPLGLHEAGAVRAGGLKGLAQSDSGHGSLLGP